MKCYQANQAYALAERDIWSSTRETSSQFRTEKNPPLHEDLSALSIQFPKEALQHARVINQVDNKFIACVVEDTSSSVRQTSTLVLIDQHAADERVRVERYLQEICLGYLCHSNNGVKKRKLDRPASVLLTTHEVQRLQESAAIREAFSRWGIIFGDLSLSPNTVWGEDQQHLYTQVEIHTIPEVVADKVNHDHLYKKKVRYRFCPLIKISFS